MIMISLLDRTSVCKVAISKIITQALNKEEIVAILFVEAPSFHPFSKQGVEV